MPEVQNVGTVDYAQYQPSQYQNDAYVEEYGNAPEVYDERAEEMKAASKSRLGATLLGLAVVGTLAYFGGRHVGKKSADVEIEKAKEAIKKYEELQKSANELNEDANKVIDSTLGGFQYGKDFAKKVKEAIKNIVDNPEKTKEVVKKESEKATDVAKELEEHASDSYK